MDKTEIIIDGFFVFVTVHLYLLNIHSIISELYDKRKPKIIFFTILALISIGTAEIPDLMDVMVLPRIVRFIAANEYYVTWPLAIFLSHRKELKKSVYVTLLYLGVDSCIGSTINIIADIFLGSKYYSLRGTVTFFIMNLCFMLIFPKLIRGRKEDIVRSLDLIPKKTYVFILVYAELMAKIMSFARVVSLQAETRPVETSWIFLTLKKLVVPAFIVSFILIVFLISNSISKYYYKRSAELLDRQLAMQVKYYEKVGQMTSDIKKFRHDYKNHMHCLNSLLNKGDVDSALEYLASISGDPAMNSTSFDSGNAIADAILCDKAAVAEREECKLTFSGVISDKISAFDICTILSNSLDNSIEACQRLKTDAEKHIDVKCVLKNDMQMISISNPSDTADATLVTSKENKAEHGFGLYNIRRTVDSLGGTIEVSQTSPVFVLDVMFRVKTA